MDPHTRGLGQAPSHDSVVPGAAADKLQLQRIQDVVDSHPHGAMQLPIWARHSRRYPQPLARHRAQVAGREGRRSSGHSASCRPLHKCGLDAPGAAAATDQAGALSSAAVPQQLQRQQAAASTSAGRLTGPCSGAPSAAVPWGQAWRVASVQELGQAPAHPGLADPPRQAACRDVPTPDRQGHAG